MAYTSIIPVHRLDNSVDYVLDEKKASRSQNADSLQAAVDYALNKDKTEQDLFCSAIGCTLDSAFEDMCQIKRMWHKEKGVQGFHLVQSFAAGEVTPELAHQIGQELADRLLGGRFQVVISTHLNTGHMLSIDVLPVPTDEAVREIQNKLLGVETNAANWQRKQNAANNFSAVLPYDMEQQRKETKEMLDDLTNRDQRMMFGLVTLVHLADTKEQLDSDTETILTVARKHLCQMSTLRWQQKDGLDTVLP